MIHYEEQTLDLVGKVFESQPPQANFLKPHLKTLTLGTNLINLPENANCKISNELTDIPLNKLPQGS